MVAIEYNKGMGHYVTYDLTEQSFIDKHYPTHDHQITVLRELYHQLNVSYQACWCGDIDLTHFALTCFNTYAPDTRLYWDLAVGESFFHRLWDGERSYHLVGYVRLNESVRQPHEVRYLTLERTAMFPLLFRLSR